MQPTTPMISLKIGVIVNDAAGKTVIAASYANDVVENRSHRHGGVKIVCFCFIFVR